MPISHWLAVAVAVALALSACAPPAAPPDAGPGLATAERCPPLDLSHGMPALLQQGHYLHATGRLTEAREHFDAVLCLDPENPWAYSGRAIVQSDLGDLERGVADFDHALALGPTAAYPDYARAPDHFNRALVRNQLGQFREAIEDLDAALRLDPALTQVYPLRGWIRMELNDYRLAAADFDEAIRLDPTSAAAFWGRALLYQRLGQHESAIRVLDDAVRLDPGRPEPLGMRGALRWVAGDLDGALADIDRSLALQPTDQAFAFRAVILAALGRADEANAAFDQAVALGGEARTRSFEELLMGHGFFVGNRDGRVDGELREAFQACIRARCTATLRATNPVTAPEQRNLR